MKKIEAKELFQKHLDFWSYIVTSFGWKFTVRYHDSRDDMPAEAGEKTVALTTAQFCYLEAVIDINEKLLQGLSEEKIEECVVHELVHLLTAPLKESSDTTPKEYTVTTITRVLCGLTCGKRYEDLAREKRK